MDFKDKRILVTGVIIRNEDLTIFGDGTNSRDFTYIKDIIQANILASWSDDAGEILQSYADISKEKRLLDFKSNFNQEQGLKEYFKWYDGKNGTTF